ncbi:LysR substrate-binding domain-containing protein [Qipengyuania flava]|uniref:LysR substrate-binding domain-containing protein n=1 Tax=Qipengyuania flava TaxID=192812 RepID=UPI00215B5F96|nr:LysR substrate-binding domain-containing protein [Qipengyuania flava]
MRLTDSGTQLLPHVRAMREAALQISRIATGQNQEAEGTVRITSSDAMAVFTLPALVVAFRQLHPKVSIELVPSNDRANLTQREADIAIRHTRPEQPDLVAKRLPDIAVSLFAAPHYLKGLPPLSTVEDLAAANFIGYESAGLLIPQMQALGIPVTRDNFGVTTSAGATMYELARQGAGIAILPAAVAEGQFGLKRAWPALPDMAVSTWLVTHREVRTSRPIRLAFDFLAAELGKNRWSDLVPQA